MLVSPSEMRALEERAFTAGATPEALMEDAGAQIARVVEQFFPRPGRCVVCFGKGHNGGDALVAARHLAVRGWRIDLRPAFPPGQWSELTASQHARVSLGDSLRDELSMPALVVLDGLLGTGAAGALREPVRGICREINRLRREENAHVFALDLPTGVDAESGIADADAVIADFTLMIGFGKRGLVADSALNHVGRVAVLPLTNLPDAADADTIATPALLAPLLARRNFDTHKGNCGRVGLLAGSRGMSGAAVMCAEGSLRGGAGLVTLYVPRDVHSIVAARASPEVMVRAINTPLDVLEAHHDVIAIGPGLGRDQPGDVRELIVRAPSPVVLDAGALDIVAEDLELLGRCARPRLLTPHPGEMARLDPLAPTRSRRETVEAWTARFPHTLLLKGARTLVGERGHGMSYNSTGHPGMASGGMGDVLTGLLAALVGQELALYDAARVGSWLVGRAAELAIFAGNESAESLRATAVLSHLGRAFQSLRSGEF